VRGADFAVIEERILLEMFARHVTKHGIVGRMVIDANTGERVELYIENVGKRALDPR
jgi:hypothetical protein